MTPQSSQTANTAGWRGAANLLTALRVVLVPLIVALLFLDGEAARWAALALFSFAAATDWIDGWVARRGVGVTRVGQLADPAADKALVLGSLAALAWLGEVAWWAVALIAVREAAVSLQRWILVRRGVVMPASKLGKAKTVSQIAAVVLLMLPVAPAALADAILWIAVVLTVVSGLEYAVRGRNLQRAG